MNHKIFTETKFFYSTRSKTLLRKVSSNYSSGLLKFKPQNLADFECLNKAKINFMKGLMMGAKTNQMNPTINEAGEKGKYLEPMRCMASSTYHMHAFVIKVMGKFGN